MFKCNIPFLSPITTLFTITAKIIDVNKEKQTTRVHYVRCNERYNESLPMSSLRIESWGGPFTKKIEKAEKKCDSEEVSEGEPDMATRFLERL